MGAGISGWPALWSPDRAFASGEIVAARGGGLKERPMITEAFPKWVGELGYARVLATGWLPQLRFFGGTRHELGRLLGHANTRTRSRQNVTILKETPTASKIRISQTCALLQSTFGNAFDFEALDEFEIRKGTISGSRSARAPG
jgi:hypothetical protein